MIGQVFKRDRKYWTPEQEEQVQVFFQFNSFFSKFYQHRDFQKVIGLTFYTKINSGCQFKLDFNKRSQAIILLSGQIDLCKKITVVEKDKRKKKNNEQVIKKEQIVKIGQYTHYNETIAIREDVIVRSANKKQAQILFIPSLLFRVHQQNIQNERLNTLILVLKRHFTALSKRQLKSLAESGCHFKEHRMHSYIYRGGSKPQFVYILLEGNVKLEALGFSTKKATDIIVISPQMMFGNKDITAETRQYNAICCSANIRLLLIPKISYLKINDQSKAFKPQVRSLSQMQMVTKDEEPQKLPKIFRFHSFTKPQLQNVVEQKLVKHCHILLNLSPKKRAKSTFRTPQKHDQDYSVNQFEEKFKLYERMHPNNDKLDLTHKFF